VHGQRSGTCVALVDSSGALQRLLAVAGRKTVLQSPKS